jgi:hypothetical protein
MSLIAPRDAAFLLGETTAQPTHVAGLAVYELPAGAEPDYVGSLYHELLTHTAVRSRLRLRPADPVGSLGNVWWTEEHDLAWSTTYGWRRCRGRGGCASCLSSCPGCTGIRSTGTIRFGSST